MDPSVHEVLQEITENKDTEMVVSTIVKVEGSAYRKPGTMMLFTEELKQVGMLSVGCLEEDASIRAQQLMKDNRSSQLIVYDMSSEHDLGWGRGTGCQGKIHVLFEKVTDKKRGELNKVQSLLKKGIGVKAMKQIDQVPAEIQTMYCAENGLTFGTVCHSEHTYVQSFLPKRRLIIFGAGADVPPLTALAKQTGFEVFVWDFREEYLNNNRLPYVHFISDWKVFNFVPSDMLIIMTHDFEKDQEIIQSLVKKPQINYLGVLGPARRTKRLLKSSTIPSYIHSPIGLEIGAEGAVEIAISIMAEVIHTMRGANSEKGSSNLLSGRKEQTFREG